MTITQIKERLELLSAFRFGAVVEEEHDDSRLKSAPDQRAVVREHVVPDLVIRTTGEALNCALLSRRPLVPPSLGYVEKRLELIRRVNDHATENGTALGIELEDKLSDHTEVRTSPTDAPEEIRILLLTSRPNAAVSGHNGSLGGIRSQHRA